MACMGITNASSCMQQYCTCSAILRLPEIIRAMPCTPRLPVSECLCRWLSQEESAQLQRQLSAEHERSVILQRDLSVSLRDSKEGLFREKEIISQLEAQDEVCNTSAQLQNPAHATLAPASATPLGLQRSSCLHAVTTLLWPQVSRQVSSATHACPLGALPAPPPPSNASSAHLRMSWDPHLAISISIKTPILTYLSQTS